MNSSSEKKIIIIGDVMLDINHYCNKTKTAPEADIPIYNIYKTDYILGGAANVANNLNILTKNVIILSVIGDDFTGNKIRELLDSNNISSKLFIDSSRPTTQKIRLIHNNAIINRHDIETINDIDISLQNELFDYICSISNIDSIVISDYAKGIITVPICEKIIQYANCMKVPTFVDPKVLNCEKYKNCFCFKPNLLEGSLIAGSNNISEIFSSIKSKISCENIVLTCGKDGMYLNDYHNHIKHSNYDVINVVDVTGCGDIVLCVIIYIYSINNDLYKACKISNHIAAKATETIGNFQLNLNIIEDAIQYFTPLKIYTLEHLNPDTPREASGTIDLPVYNDDNKIIYDFEINKIQNLGINRNIIFTNGCFDIVHSAHIRLLKYAKSLGDILVVGLNSDNSIRSIKGESRPINNEYERTQFLINLDWVDYIIIFNDDTPYNILKYLNPSTIVKGGDYTADKIIGKEFAKNVVLFNYIQNCSTTNVIKSVRKNLMNNKLSSAYILSHNGLGDNVAMIGAVHFLSKYYDKIFFLCKDIYFSQIEYLYRDYDNILVIEIPSYDECNYCKSFLESKFESSDIYICGNHKSYLESKITHPDILKFRKDYTDNYDEYPSYNIYKGNTNYSDNLIVPKFYWFIEMCYYDIGIPISAFFNNFQLSNDDEIITLYNNISQYKIIFLHTSTSSNSNFINISYYTDKFLNDDDYIFICVNKNYYDITNPKYNIANQYLNLSTIFHYIEIMKNATSIHISDSCFSCLLLPLMQSSQIKTNDINIYDRTTGNTIDLPVTLSKGSPIIDVQGCRNNILS